MQAMIFAAGLGTRLRPLTDTMPKALVEVGGKPLIGHVMEKLIGAGVGRVVVNVHHFADQIVGYLHANGDFGIDIRISDESGKLLDTGGGIRKAAALFDTGSPVLIHNVDILSDIDVRSFYRYACERCCDALLLVSSRRTSRYLLFDDDMRLAGWTNTDTGEVRGASPSLATFRHTLDEYAFSGVHVFSPSLFPLMDVYPEKFGIMDFYLDVCADAGIYGYVDESLQLLDVGKPEAIAAATEFLQRNTLLPDSLS